MKIADVKIGNVYALKQCKHSWNNGKKVVIESIGKDEDGETEFIAKDYPNPSPTFGYALGIENLESL